MDISKHISYLLQFHECVIIPDFGGFISNYVPSHFDEKNQSYSPPGKEVVFNSKIKKNDGLLLNFLVEEENLSYREARFLIERYVEQLYWRLNHGEQIEFPGLGYLTFSQSGAILFQPVVFLQLIETYGLTKFTPTNFSITHEKGNTPFRPAVRVIYKHKNPIQIAASIALILTLSLFPLKKERSVFLSSNINPFTLFNTTSEQETEPEEKEGIHLTEINVSPVVKPFILVGGSFQQKGNADQYKNELIEKGHPSEVLYVKDHFFRVSIDSYSDWQEALLAMKQYRENHPGSEVWVSKR